MPMPIGTIQDENALAHDENQDGFSETSQTQSPRGTQTARFAKALTLLSVIGILVYVVLSTICHVTYAESPELSEFVDEISRKIRSGVLVDFTLGEVYLLGWDLEKVIVCIGMLIPNLILGVRVRKALGTGHRLHVVTLLIHLGCCLFTCLFASMTGGILRGGFLYMLYVMFGLFPLLALMAFDNRKGSSNVASITKILLWAITTAFLYGISLKLSPLCAIIMMTVIVLMRIKRYGDDKDAMPSLPFKPIDCMVPAACIGASAYGVAVAHEITTTMLPHHILTPHFPIVVDAVILITSIIFVVVFMTIFVDRSTRNSEDETTQVISPDSSSAIDSDSGLDEPIATGDSEKEDEEIS